MNIAILIVDISLTGGAERVALCLSRYLSRNHNITIVSLFSKESNLINNEINVIHCNLDRPKNRLSTLKLRYIPKKPLIEFLNSYDLVISNNVFRYYVHTSHIKTKSIDLFAMSTHRRNFFDKLFGKSVTKKMVYHTKIPLLAFHYKKDPIIFT